MEHLIELILPPIIGVLEMMGIFVVAVSAVRAFAEYLGTLSAPALRAAVRACRRPCHRAEFKMAAEI